MTHPGPQHVGVDAERNEQLRIYAAAFIATHKLPVKFIRYAIVQPNDFRPVPRVKQWAESYADLYAFAIEIAKIPHQPKTFTPGEHCTYCPLFEPFTALRLSVVPFTLMAVNRGCGVRSRT